MDEGQDVAGLLENATGIIHVWQHKNYRKAIVSAGILVALATSWCLHMEFNVGDLKEKSANHLKAETDLNTKTDKLSEKVDLGFNRLGDKMDKLSDDTHRLMGRADAIRGINP